MELREYEKKRDFRKTSEPRGQVQTSRSGRLFVVQKHDASRLHFDFRLEHDGVLLSFAIPKGPSLDPGEKRLAVRVEDHPVKYGDFEGVIPEKEYGGGTVMLWDRGTWEPLNDPDEGLKNGDLKFRLDGERLAGAFALVRMKRGDGDGWLLIKKNDEAATKKDILKSADTSVTTGRSMTEIAADADRVWGPEGEEKARPESIAPKKKARVASGAKKSARPALSRMKGAKKASMPKDARPQLATLVDEAPAGAGWIHEIKYDGYRAIARIERGKARLVSRSGKDQTKKFSPIADALADIDVKDAVLDGEVVVLLPDGRTSFQALQNVLSGVDAGRLVYFVFDALHLDGYDLTGAPLSERKRALAAIVPPSDSNAIVRFGGHIEGQGGAVYDNACRLGLEGIVSKRADASYAAGKRTRTWVKVKCTHRQEFVIGGFTEPGGSRQGFGALLVGYHNDGGDLVYAGRVGTGFDDKTLKNLASTLSNIERKTSPFAGELSRADKKGAHFVTPNLVAEVAFTEWTKDGVLRHPSYQGLRADKSAADVVREEPERIAAAASKSDRPPPRERSKGSNDATVAGIRITHPDRVVYPDAGLNKRAIAEYYERVAPAMLAHLANRPLTFLRAPSGVDDGTFFQKHFGDDPPPHTKVVPIREKDGTGNYLVVADARGLVSLVQYGVLEFHAWGCRADRIESPDRLIFDLDPAPDVEWKAVTHAALMLREVFADLGLKSFAKTSGGKGLHVVVPIERRSGWDEAKDFARAIAERVAKNESDRYVATMSKKKREGKIFIDYLRNARGQTAVAPYSLRARAGAPISAPVTWDEVEDGIRGDAITLADIGKRLRRADPWAGIESIRQSITKKALGALGLS
ncbi:DNA ligase D [bacterium]|nr:DNA ligase D [bacterium]